MKTKYHILIIAEPGLFRSGLEAMLKKQLIDYCQFEVIDSKTMAEDHLSKTKGLFDLKIEYTEASYMGHVGFQSKGLIVSKMSTNGESERLLLGMDCSIQKLLDTITELLDIPYMEIEHSRQEGVETRAIDNETITDKEKEILILIAQGKTNLEIAGIKNISLHTVSDYRKRLIQKLGVRKSVGLAIYAYRKGWIRIFL
ncbi:MAG: response regulator transcription factor [Bacteroidetes bacterium]|nr:MAG: response regulator transcription factor [Bacteroidota bacterium]